MTNYQESKIYKIICNTTKKIYYGSTTTSLEKCLKTWVNRYNTYKKGKGSNSIVFQLLENNDYKIELVVNCPCNSKEELKVKKFYFTFAFHDDIGYRIINKYGCSRELLKKYLTKSELEDCMIDDSDEEEL
jgi:hypothetical protein